MLVALFCVPILVVLSVGEAISRAFNWTWLSFLPPFILRPLLILVLVFIALQTGFGATAMTAAYCALLASFAIAVFQLAGIGVKLHKNIPLQQPIFKTRYWIAITLPIFLVESFYVILTSVDVLFMAWLATPEETAIYFAATKILALVHFVYFAVRSASAHRYSSYHASGNTQALSDYVRQSVSWTFWPSLVIGAMMVLTGEYFLCLFGDEFISGAAVLGVLVAGIVIRSSVGPAESLLVMTGNQNACALIYVCALFVNVTLNVSLIPQYGMMGAAIATTIAFTFESLALYAAIKRSLGIHAFVFPLTGRRTTSGGVA
ncbi:MAG: polysaccharide biosynthesis C-terminal domain-containing protein [Pseudomonadota bacterium]